MLDTDYTEDYTKDAEILYGFHVDENKREYLKNKIIEAIASCKGLFSKFKKKKLEEMLDELDNIQTYYITDNNYLFTVIKDSKYVYDLNLAYDLSKEPQEYLKDIGVDFISSYIDSSGCGCFEKNEAGEYVGSFGWFDGVSCITIWDIFQEDIYSVLKQYIKEEKVNESILSEFEI